MSTFPESRPSPRLAYAVTVDLSVKLIEGQCTFLAANGFEVNVICSPGPRLRGIQPKGVTPWPINMAREISLPGDVLSLWRLWRLFRRIRPDIVVAGTPKAGLLGTLAARLAGVPHVQYSLLGLRFETAAGIKRRVLMGTEWIACHAADSVRCVSESVRGRVIALRLAPPHRCTVIGNGTSEGIDVERFAAAAKADGGGKQMRRKLKIPLDARVVGFVGRVTRDKGIRELYEAFTRLRVRSEDLRLLLVGDFEQGDPVPEALRQRIRADARVICTGFVEDVERYYPAMDVLALASYREGFGTVLLEAQAAGIPVVTTDATGAMDGVVDGETGLRVPVGDVDALTCALYRLLGDTALRARMGAAGQIWVERNFRCEQMWQQILMHCLAFLGFDQEKGAGRIDLGRTRAFDVQKPH